MILVISDNIEINSYFKKSASRIDERFSYFTSSNINVVEDQEEIVNKYDIVFSAHCKQIFPKSLVDRVRCINIHPGYNPYNRGWYPHVFSIINKLPAGATIHEMDEKLDHGSIICQEEVEIDSWDTGESLYRKVINAERSLIEKWLKNIIDHEYVATSPTSKGNLNTKLDFENLCRIDSNSTVKVSDFVDLLRATSYSEFDNAFLDDELYVKILLNRKNS